jgi:DNA-directed RNA polymerase subunit RPC12/RpoP
MEFQDKQLKCVDCGTDFVFTAGEQLFFYDKQFKNEPKRCKNCKGKRIAVVAPGQWKAHQPLRTVPGTFYSDHEP